MTTKLVGRIPKSVDGVYSLEKTLAKIIVTPFVHIMNFTRTTASSGGQSTLNTYAATKNRSTITIRSLIVGIVLAISALVSFDATAQITRPFTVRYTTNTNGDIKLIGNTVMACSALPLSGACANAAAGIPNAPFPNELLDNNDWMMTNIDVDSDPSTFNSSSATLSMPFGSTVQFAGLYWSATSASSQRGQVLFKTPTSFGYSGISASTIDSASGQASNYSAFANVTSAVIAAGNGVYSVANVQTIQDVNNWGGWVLVVVYQNMADTIKNLVVYDGYGLVNSTNPVTITPTGFLTPLSGPVISRVGAAGFDGDLSRTGDRFSINSTFLGDALNPNNNFFNASLSENGVSIPGRSPNFVNNFGVDVDRLNVPSGVIPNGATSAVLQLSAPGENYHPNVITFATDLYVPIIAANVTKTVLDVNGGTLLAGDVMRWTIAMSNTGFDTGTNLIVKDPIPVGTTYVTGSLRVVTGANAGVKTDVAADDVAEFSNVLATCAPVANPCVIFRLGNGANGTTGGNLAFGQATSLTFDTSVNPSLPPGTTITNSASISFSGQTLGATFTTASAAATGAVLSPPLIAKSFSPPVVVVNSPSTLTIVLSNPATNTSALTGVSFTDTYPANLFNTLTPGANIVCTPGSTPGALTGGVASGNTINMPAAGGGATILPGGSCTITVQVTATSAGPKVNTTSVVASTNAGNGTTASATLFGGKISITKSFSAPIIEVGGAASTITFTLTNATGIATTGVAFSDTYPGALQNDATVGTNTCGGTLTAANGMNVLSLSGGAIATIGGTCTITKTVVGVAPGGPFTNTTSGVTRTGDAVPGNIASAPYTVVAAPTVVKTFSPNPVNINDVSTLSIVLTNPNTTTTVTRIGAVFLDTYPAGLVNTPTAFVTLNCTGGSTASVTAGTGLASGSTIGLSDMTLAPLGSCTVTSVVIPTTAGNKINPAFTATFDNAPDPIVAAATLTVTLLTEPTITKTFLTNPILIGGSSVMRIRITNVNAGAAITNVSFTDNYPSGLFNTATPSATISNIMGTCTSSMITAAANGTSLALSGLNISASGICQIDVNVSAPAAGGYFNDTGIVTVTNTPPQIGATATLNVLGPPTISKSFLPATMPAGGTSTLTVVISNPGGNPLSLTNVSFSDVFPVAPGAMTLASPLTTTNVCTVGSTVGTLQNSSGGALAVGDVGIRINPAAGATILPGGSCTITADVTASVVGNYNNLTSTVASSNGGTGTTAAATLSIAKLSISKSFSPTVVNNGAPSVVTFTISNPTGATRSGLSFSDNLAAANLAMSNAVVGGDCTGVVSNAAIGQTNFVVTAGTVPSPAGCTITINVSSNIAGTRNNQTSGASYTGDAIPGAPSNIATLLILSSPTVTQSFTPTTIPVSGTSVFTISLANPNGTDMTGVSFANTYPINLRNAVVTGAATTCTGTPVVTASANAVNPGTLSLSGATIPANSTCTVTVNVTTTVAGIYTNTFTAGALTTSAGSNVNPASATLSVLLPPTVAKSFGPTGVAVNANSLLTITLTNPNPAIMTGVAFSDTYPADLRNALVPNASTTCPTGSAVASPNGTNPGTLVFTGGSIAANSSCTVTVNVTSAISNNYTNSTGTISSTNAGNSVSPATAILSVGVPSISKVFSPNPIILGSTSTLNFTITNGSPITMTGVGFTDNFPTMPGLMVVASPVVSTNTCGGTFAPVALAGSVALSGGSVPANSTCTLSVRVSMPSAGVYANTSGAVSATGPLVGNTASANLTVNVALPVLTKAFSSATIGIGQTTTLTFTINNSATGTINQTGLGFTDTLPGTGGLTATAASPQCGGGTVAITSGNIITITGAALNAGTSCTITATVAGVSAGSYINGPTNGSITGVTSNLTNSVTNQALDVRQASLTKAFGAATFPEGGATTIIYTISNGVGNPAQSAIGFTETLPASLRFNSASQTVTYGSGCSGPATVTASGAPNLNSFALVGVAMTAATATCTITVTGVTNLVGVSGACPAATQTNDFTKITALNRLTNAVAGGPCVSIVPLPTLTKAFGAPSINNGSNTTLAFTLTNGTGNPVQSALGFTETLPANLRFNAASQAVTYGAGCSGPATITATGSPNLNTFNIAGLGMTVGTATCTVTIAGVTNVVGVTGTCPLPAQTNDSTRITGLALLVNGVGTGPCLTVSAIPTLTKAFGLATIDDGGSTSLVFTLTNGAGNPAQAGIGFTETLPASLRFNAASQSVTYGSGCAGPATVTTTGAPNLNTFPIAGISMTAGTVSCLVTVTGVTNVVGATGTCPLAARTNASSGITALAQLLNGVGAGPCLAVAPLPVLTKSFGANPQTIGVGQTATLTFTINNSAAGAVNRTALNFTDTLPGGGVNLTAVTTTPQCGVGAVSVMSGNIVTVTGASLNAGTNCTITATVTGVIAGSYVNGPAQIGGLSANLTNGVTNQTLNVTPPGLTKAFGAASIVDTNSTTIVYTLTNATGNPVQSGIGFTETLPASLRFGAASQTVTYGAGCTGPATVTATGTPNLNAFTIAGIGMNAGTPICTVTISGVTNVTGITGMCPQVGQTNDSTKITGLTVLTNNVGAGPCLTILPVPFPILTKAFTAGTIGVGQTTTLTFTINNTAVGTINRTGLNFTDTLPGVGGITAVTTTPQCGGGTVVVSGVNNNVITVTGAAVNAAMSCTITATVTGVTATVYVNGSTNITAVSANLTNSVIDQTLNVRQASVTKAFGAASIVDGGTTTLVFTLANGAGNPLQSGIGFTETLPASLRFGAAMQAATYAGGCTGPATVTASGTPNLNAFTIAGIGMNAGTATCTVTIAGVTNVTGATGTCSQVAQTNDSTKVTLPIRLTNNLGAGPCLTINTTAQPLLTKSFGANPQTIGIGQTTTLTFTLNNNVVGAINRTGMGFVDTLPVGLTATTTSPQCGGTVAISGVNNNIITVTGATLNAGLSCTITATITGATAGSYINGAANISSLLVLSNSLTNQTLNVIQPNLTKAFGAATIPDTGATTVVYTFTNSGTNPAQSGIGFTETLPASLRFSAAAPTVAYSTGCSGPATVTATGSPLNTFPIAGVAMTAGTASCTATISSVTNVVGVTGACPLAAQTNDSTKITLPVRLTNGVGAGPCLGIVPLPILTKAFGAASIDSGATTTLVFTLNNSAGGAPVQTLLGFTETLPANLRFTAASQAVTYSPAGCTGPATITATGTPNLNAFSIAGIGITTGTTSCAVTVAGVTNVANTSGACPAAAQTNDGTRITALSRLTNSVGAGPCLVVQPFPVLTKSFGANPQTIGVGQTATLTFTINNAASATVNRTALGFTDTLPGTGGITAVTTTPQCGGGTVTVSGVNNNVITVANSAVNAGMSCTITATVTGVTANSYTNNTASITGVTANLTNGVVSEVLNVRQAALTKLFGALSIDDGGSTTLVYTLTNGTGNPTQTGIGFTEALPTGLQFNAASQTVAYSAGCMGPATVTVTGAPLSTFSIAGISMPAVASCTVTVTGVTNATGVTGTCPNATRTNDSTRISALVRLTNNVGTGPCLAIAPEPILTKSFGTNPQNIGLGQSATLTFTINNSAANTILRSGIGFVDTLTGAGGITATVATPQCGGGTVTVSGVNNNIITVSGASVAAGTSCTITATVTGNTLGAYVNGPAEISGLTANINSAIVNQTLNVVQPALTKVFGAMSIVDTLSTTLVYTLTNGTGNPLQSGIGFTELLPTRLRFNAASQTVTYSSGCTGPATITATGAPDLNTFGISGIGMSAATASCTVTISGVTNVVGQTGMCPQATQTNDSTRITGLARLTNSVGAGPCLTISPVPFPILTKSFGANPQTIGVGQTATLTFTINNTAVGTINRTGLGFVDTLPGAGGITAAVSSPQCGGGTVTVSGLNNNVITVANAAVNAGLSCTVTATITGVTAAASNTYTNSSASLSGVTANLTNGVTPQVLDVRQAALTKAFGAGSIVDGNATTLVFTLTNGTGNPLQSGIGFTETLPANLRFNAASQTVTYSNTCTGPASITATGTPNLNAFTIAGISMPAGIAACTVTVTGVTNLTGVTGNCAAVAQTNDSTKITGLTRLTNSIGAGPCLAIAPIPQPVLTKSFGANPQTIGSGLTTTLTFTINNTGVGAINRTGLAFIDTLPGAGGITAVATAPTCSETVNVTGGGNNVINVTGASVNAGATCTIAVTITGVIAAGYTNGAAQMSGVSPVLTNSVTNQVLNVRQAGLTKAFGAVTIDDGATTTLIYTLTNGTGNPAQAGLGFTETLPGNLRFNSASPSVTYGMGCSGPNPVTATGGPNLNTFVITGLAMAASTASCTVTVAGVTNLVGVTGNCPQPLQTNDSTKVTALQWLANNIGAGPCLAVAPAPTITKAFGAASIDDGAATTLIYTITNSAGNPVQTGMAFTETLPTNLRFNAASQSATYAGCTGPASVTTSGSPLNVFSIAGIGMAAATPSCTVTISGVTNVVGITGSCPSAAQTNDASKLTGLVRLVNGLGAGPCLTIVPLPVLTKAFTSNTIGVGQTTTLTFSINNTAAGTVLRNGLSFTDTLPGSGGITATASSPQCGGTVSVTGGNVIAVSGATVAAGMTCLVTATVTGVTAATTGTYTNGPLNSSITGVSANLTNSVTNQVLDVRQASLIKAFGVSAIDDGLTTTIVYTLTNGAGNPAQSGIDFTETLPSGLRFNAASQTVTYSSGCSGPGMISVTGSPLNTFTIAGLAMSAATVSCTITVSGLTNAVGSTNSCPSAVQTNDATRISGLVRLTNSVGSGPCLTVVPIATITKAFGAASIIDSQPTTLVYTITNGPGDPLQLGMGFTETLPTGLRFTSSTLNVTYSSGCTGPATVSATGGPPLNTFTIAGINLGAENNICTVTVSSVTNVAGLTGACPAVNQTNDSSKVTSLVRLINGLGAGPCLGIAPLPILTKAFGTTEVALNGTTTLTFSIANTAAGNVVRNGLSFTDLLQSGLQIANPPTPISLNCGTPIFSAVDAMQTFAASSINVAAGATCTITLNVRGVTAGARVNTNTDITSISSLLTNGVSSQTLNVYAPPNLTKAVSTPIASGGTGTLTLTLTNPMANPGTLSTVRVDDTFPMGTTLSNTTFTFTPTMCGTVTKIAGGASAAMDNNVRFTSATLAANASCQVQMTVTSSTAGTVTNTTNAPTAITPNAITLTGTAAAAMYTITSVVNPTLTKLFAGTKEIAINGSNTITFTLGNTNLIALTNASFTDDFPSGMSLANTTVGGTCVAGSVTSRLTNMGAFGTITAAHASIQLSGYTIPASGNCTVTVNVTGTTAGAKLNTTSTMTTVQGTTTVAASDTLNVYTPPTLTKAVTTPIAYGGTGTLTLTLTNPMANPGTLSTVRVDDTFPMGTTLSNTTFSSTPMACGTVTKIAGGASAAGDNNVRFTSATLAANASCQVQMTVTSSTAGTVTNTTNAPTATAPNATALTGTAAAAMYTVSAPLNPTLTKVFAGTKEIAVNGSNTITFTLGNTNLIALTNATFTDDFPAGMSLANTTVGGTCTAGSVTSRLTNMGAFGAITAAHASIQLSGYTIPASNTCTVTVNVTGTTAGAKLNTTSTMTTAEGTMTAAASDTLNVYAAPTLTKAFVGPIDTSANTTLTLTFANPAANPGVVSGISVSDTLPTSPSAMTIANATVGGTCTATVLDQSAMSVSVGDTGIQVSGISLAAGASCTVIVNVTASIAGNYVNTTGNVAATTPVSLTGTTASDTLIVRPRPVLTKSFGANPQTIGIGQNATLTFTIDNTAVGAILRSGIGFIDTLPGAGALTATTSTPQCGGGAITVTGGNIINVSGASVNSGSTCTITATVTGVTVGSYINGPTNSSIAGLAGALVSAVADQTLNVLQATVAKTFAAASINDGATTTLVFTLTNGAGNPAQAGIALGDTLPTGLRFTNVTPGLTYSMGCSGPALAAYDAMTRVLSGISGVAMTLGTSSCTVTVGDITNTPTQTNASCVGNPAGFTNLIANVTTTRATNTSSDQCLVVNTVNPTLTKSWSASPINDAGTTNLIFTLTNSGTNPAQSGISFTESLPASLRFTSGAPTINFGAGCTGMSAVTQAMPDSIAFSGITMAATTASCTITVTAVTNRAGLTNASCMSNPVAFTNGSANISPSSGVINGVTNQCVIVNTTPPVLTKAWGAATIVDGASTTLVFTLTNTGSNPAQTGIGFVESLPSSLRFTSVAPAVAFGAGCSGASVVAQALPDTITFSGVAMTNATASCTITVTGLTNRAGQVNASCTGDPAAFTNSTANISGLANLTSSVLAQCITVTTVAPTIAKAFMPATISAGGTSTISFTLTNANSVALTAANFTDTLTNIRVSGAQTVTGCSGSNMFTADQTGLLNFAGLTIPAAGNCTITLLVTSNTPGMLPNTTAGVASANAPTGAASNTANLTVNASAPSIVKSFVTPTIALGATSQIDFTITNPNAIALTAAAFSDTLANMFIHATAAATGTCVGAGTNNFTINQTGLLNFTGLTIPASSTCTVSIVVRSNTPGMQPNFATGVSSAEAPTGVNSASVVLTVNVASPTISKAFAANPIASGGVATLTITITNPNAGPISVTSVTDTFPTMPSTGLVRASTPNASTTCASGMVTHAPSSVTLTGGTVPANASCTFQIDVTAATAGAYVNNIGIGALTTNAGSNTAAATATLTVTAVANVSITKSAPATVPWGTTITYMSTVTNAGPDAADLTVFSDTVPAAITGVGAVCGLPTGGALCGTVNVSMNTVTSAITTLPAGGSVTFTVTGTAPQSGTLSNSATAIVPMGVSDPDDPTRIGAGNNTSPPAVTVVQSPDLRLAKTAAVMSLTVGVDASFTLTPSNTGTLATSGMMTVIETLPIGLTYVALGSGGTGWICVPSGQVVTCTSSTVIGAGGTGNAITINVQVLSNAVPAISNVATIAGGNEPSINNGNNIAVLNLLVGNAAFNTFTTDGMQTGMPGASLLYTHTFNANISGTVSFNSINVPSPSVAGWTVQLFRDTNCNGMLDGAEGATEITNTVFNVTAVQQLCIVTKSNIPANAPFSAVDIISVTASFTPISGPVVTYTRVDITTVGSSQGSGLVLSKSVRNVTQGTPAGTSNMARPGNVLEYLIAYTNTSNSPLSTIALSDATPAYTTFLSADCVTPLPNNITTCIASTAPAMGGAGAIVWTVTGSLIPMQVGTVRFRVTVQ